MGRDNPPTAAHGGSVMLRIACGFVASLIVTLSGSEAFASCTTVAEICKMQCTGPFSGSTVAPQLFGGASGIILGSSSRSLCYDDCNAELRRCNARPSNSGDSRPMAVVPPVFGTSEPPVQAKPRKLTGSVRGVSVMSAHEFMSSLRSAMVKRGLDVSQYSRDLNEIEQITIKCPANMPLLSSDSYNSSIARRVCEVDPYTNAPSGGFVLKPFVNRRPFRNISVRANALTNEIDESKRATFFISVMVQKDGNVPEICTRGGAINPILVNCSDVLEVAYIRP